MSAYKHKKTGNIVYSNKYSDHYIYKGEDYRFGTSIPKWTVEDSIDWEKLETILTTEDGYDIYNSDQEIWVENRNNSVRLSSEIGQALISNKKPIFSTRRARDKYYSDKSNQS